MFCPYCDNDLTEATRFTDEHIVPYAIGGSLGLSIRVCEPCNNVLGSRVDSPFMDDFFISSKRLELELKGHRGKPPKLTFEGTMQAFGKEVAGSYSVTPISKELHVQKPVNKSIERLEIVGGQSQVDEILNNFAGHGIDITGARAEIPTMHAQFDFSLPVITRECVKMGLGLAHRQLGEPYSRSSDARLLRDFVREDHAVQRAHIPLRGNIRLVPDQLGELFKADESHVTVLMNAGDGLVFLVLIFGQYQGTLRVSSSSHDMDVGDGWVFTTDPRTRTVKSHSALQYIADRTTTQNSTMS